MSERETYLIRVWMPDRPGALGSVASRLGALKGDVVGLEIVERSGGRAIDEIVVSLPADVPVDLVAREVGEEEDVTVEDIRCLTGTTYDPQLDVLEVAAILLGAESYEDLADALCSHVGRSVRASWAGVIDSTGVIGASGETPNDAWLSSFVAGSPAAAVEGSGPDLDTIWVALPSVGAALVIGRDAVFRARERQRLAALARIADAWFRRLAEASRRECSAVHPAGGVGRR